MNLDVEKIIEPMKKQIQDNFNIWLKEKELDVGTRLTGVSHALQKTADELEQQKERGLADLVRSVCRSMDEMIEQLEENGSRDLWQLMDRQDKEKKDGKAGIFIASLIAGFISGRSLRHADGPERENPTDTPVPPVSATVSH